MLQVITAIERDGSDRTVTQAFDVPDEEFDLVEAVEKAAEDYVTTAEGLKFFAYNCGRFNWCDFVAYVPNEICEKYGFKKIDPIRSDIIVGLDEQLVNGSNIPAEFTSVWDGSSVSVTSPCKVDIETKKVFDIEPAGEDVIDLCNTLDKEYITLNGIEYPVYCGGDGDVPEDGFWRE